MQARDRSRLATLVHLQAGESTCVATLMRAAHPQSCKSVARSRRPTFHLYRPRPYTNVACHLVTQHLWHPSVLVVHTTHVSGHRPAKKGPRYLYSGSPAARELRSHKRDIDGAKSTQHGTCPPMQLMRVPWAAHTASPGSVTIALVPGPRPSEAPCRALCEVRTRTPWRRGRCPINLYHGIRTGSRPRPKHALSLYRPR